MQEMTMYLECDDNDDFDEFDDLIVSPHKYETVKVNKILEKECMVLKHLITSQSTLNSCIKWMIPDFFIYKQEGTTVSYTSELFEIIKNYYLDCSGRLTARTLKSILAQSAHKDEILNIWDIVNEQEYIEDEEFQIILDIKSEYCNRAFSSALANPELNIPELMTEELVRIQSIEDELPSTRKPIIDNSNRTNYILEQFNKTEIEGCKCGMPPIDETLNGFANDDLILFLMETGCGKSTIMMNWAYHAYSRQDKNVLFITLEMSERTTNYRLSAMNLELEYKDIAYKSISPKLLEQQLKKYDLSRKDKNNNFTIVEGIDDKSPEAIEQIIKDVEKQNGKLDMVVIDYLGMMTSRNPNILGYEIEKDNMKKLAGILKRIACPILIAQQITASGEQEQHKRNRDGTDNDPETTQISGSKEVRFPATQIFMAKKMTTDDGTDSTCFYHKKSRDGEFAPTFIAQYEAKGMRMNYLMLKPDQKEKTKIKIETKEIVKNTPKDELSFDAYIPDDLDENLNIPEIALLEDGPTLKDNLDADDLINCGWD